MALADQPDAPTEDGQLTVVRIKRRRVEAAADEISEHHEAAGSAAGGLLDRRTQPQGSHDS